MKTRLKKRALKRVLVPIVPGSDQSSVIRAALEQVHFYSGYGVEIGLLIDIFEKLGLRSIAQVDLQERTHHSQPLEALSKMSFAIFRAVMRKLEARYGQSILEAVNKTMKPIRYEDERFKLDIEEIAEQERPPMIETPKYRAFVESISQRRWEDRFLSSAYPASGPADDETFS